MLELARRGEGPLAGFLEELRSAGDAGLVLGGPRIASGSGHAAGSVLATAMTLGTRFQYVTRRANDRGALLAGVHPRLLPGGRRFDVAEARAEVEATWGPVMTEAAGRDSRGILRAAADGELDVLYLIGVDPLTDHPDATLARRALDNVPVKVVQSLELGPLGSFADAFLPAAAYAEKDGHLTTWEGRGQRIYPVRPVEGISRPDWEIFAGLAAAMGGDLGFDTLEELYDEMGRVLAQSSASPAPETAPSVEEPPRVPDGSVHLFTYPLLVDEGRLVERADELKLALEEPAFLELHTTDAAALGIADGARAIVRTEAGEAELPVRVRDHVAPRTAFVPFNNPGLRANTLLSGSFDTIATVEAVSTADEGSQAEEVPA